MRAEKHQRICRKTGKPDGIRWKFWKYNPDRRRNEAVPQRQIPQHIRVSQNEAEVLSYCKSQAAIEDSVRSRAEKLREWKEKYHDFNIYLDKFGNFQKERAPNSWENDVFYLENYAFGFFLTHSNLNNLNQWHLMFDDFKKWLKETKPLKYRRDHLALNTQIKIIKALNRFLAFCVSKGWIEQIHKCSSYNREDTVTVNADDLFQDHETPLIYSTLKNIRPISADLFIILIRSGLRINGALGLCSSFLYQGQLDGKKTSVIHKRLRQYGLEKYHGYICLENQPAQRSIRIDENWIDRFGTKWQCGSVPRKPLKCRKRIDPKYFRYIPIFDADAWNILVDRALNAEDHSKSKTFGSEAQNYLLFDGITSSMFSADLTAALNSLKLPQRSPHKARHTFLTWFYSLVGEDEFLADKVAGHRDKRDIERYCHLSEIMGREQKEKQKGKQRLKRVSSVSTTSLTLVR
jgi:integrase